MSDIHADFHRFKEQCRERGWFARPTGRLVTELCLHVATTVAGIVVLIVDGPLLMDAVGLLLVTLGLTGVGTNSHTSAHYATARTPWINEALTYFGYPFFLQVSATFWWDKHNVRHHPHPNVIDVDPDVDPEPWLALTQNAIERQRGWRRWYYEQQWFAFPFIVAMNGFGFQLSGWIHLVTTLVAGPRSRKHWLDLLALAAHWIVWIVIPAMFLPLSSVIAFHVARALTMGFALFAVLAPCHFPAEAQAMTSGDWRRLDFIGRQTLTSINFETSPYGNLICSGLNFHIEHHLLPSMSHVYYPQVSPLLREFCEAHGYPYRSYGWGLAIWKSCQNVWSPKIVPSEATGAAVLSAPGRTS